MVVAACTANVGLVPPERMSPKELATYAMGIYNAQFDDYMAKATLPDLSDSEKFVLRMKKQSLETAWPVIRTYVWFVDKGQVPSSEIQAQLISWVNSVRY